jgi:hypothetical protein
MPPPPLYTNSTGSGRRDPLGYGSPPPMGAGPGAAAFNSTYTGPPAYNPGENINTPGYGQQAFEHTQNMLLNDPNAAQYQDLYQQTQQQNQGEQFINQNLGSLSGPGQGNQYWNQQQDFYTNPGAGTNYVQNATGNFSPTGAASAFNDQAQGSFGAFTQWGGAGNTQGQYGQSAGELAGGTQAEGNLAAIAGGYQQYGGPNLAAGQYSQTQAAFGDLPIAEFDPFFDRARQLATQDYNRQAAGRGVYGSSEALSGVGNVITDIEAQRALRSFDAEMQRAQEQRARQQLLGEQARAGDQSSIEGYQASTEAAQTYGNINRDMGQLQLDRNELLGDMAFNADTVAQQAQDSNIRGMDVLGGIANNADRAETDRYEASTRAMLDADRLELDRRNAGADIAFRSDDADRADYIAETNAAQASSNAANDRLRAGREILDSSSGNDLQRVEAFNRWAQSAEGQRMARQLAQLNITQEQQRTLLDFLQRMDDRTIGGDQARSEDEILAELAPVMEEMGMAKEDQEKFERLLVELVKTA